VAHLNPNIVDVTISGDDYSMDAKWTDRGLEIVCNGVAFFMRADDGASHHLAFDSQSGVLTIDGVPADRVEP